MVTFLRLKPRLRIASCPFFGDSAKLITLSNVGLNFYNFHNFNSSTSLNTNCFGKVFSATALPTKSIDRFSCRLKRV